MSHVIEVVLTDAEFDAVAANVPGKDADRVREYLQGQVDTITGQHLRSVKQAAFAEVGLSPVLADAKLDADIEAFILDAAAVKKAAKVEAEVKPK